MPSHCGNRPTPISVFSDQPRTKSTTSSRTSCGTQLLVKAPQDFFLARCARPSVRPGLRPWSGPSSPRTRSAFASLRPDGLDVPSPGRQKLRSQRTLSASDKTRWVVAPVPHTDRKPEPCLRGVASEWLLSLLLCSACALFSYVLSVILTKERSLQFQLRQDTGTTFRPAESFASRFGTFNSFPCVRITQRSMKFASSRTLPFHGAFVRASMAFREMNLMPLPIR